MLEVSVVRLTEEADATVAATARAETRLTASVECSD